MAFSMAADWLGNIAGIHPSNIEKIDATKDPVVRDLKRMQDDATLQTKLPASKYQHQQKHHSNKGQPLNQPKPKFVAHKQPKVNKSKDKAQSNRLGKRTQNVFGTIRMNENLALTLFSLTRRELDGLGDIANRAQISNELKSSKRFVN